MCRLEQVVTDQSSSLWRSVLWYMCFADTCWLHQIQL